MHFPSLENIRVQAIDTLKRFPVVIGVAAVAFFSAWVLIHYPHHKNAEVAEWAVRILMPALLGLSFSLGIGLFAERYVGLAKRRTAWLAGVALLVAYGFSFELSAPAINTYRFWHFMVAAHLWVAAAAFLLPSDNRGFWTFNRILFQRILLSLLYSGTLFLGLCIALNAIHHLLGFKVDGKVYADLWIFLAFIFNTWFFLAGAPRDGHLLERDDSFPTGLKAFVQFVLIPLLTCYVVILYLYMGKIMWTQTWPQGTIGWLVSIVSVLGTLCWLLLHPLRSRSGHAWIHFYARTYFYALIPLLALLMMALWRRISEYGITEERYMLCVLALWMLGIALWYITRPDADIRIVPLSLAGVVLLTAFGPWSSFDLRSSQMHRLEKALGQAGLLVDGKVTPAAGEVPWEIRKKIKASLDYLIGMHGMASIRPLFGDLVKTISEESFGKQRIAIPNVRWVAKTSEVMKAINVKAVEQREVEESIRKSFNYHVTQAQMMSIEGFEWAGRITPYGGQNTSFAVGKDTFTASIDTTGARVLLSKNGKQILEASLKPLIASLASKEIPGNEPLVVDVRSGSIRLRVVFESLSGDATKPEAPLLHHANGWIFLDL